MYDSIRGVLVIIFDDVTDTLDDVILLIIECMLISILHYFMIWFCLLNAQTGKYSYFEC